MRNIRKLSRIFIMLVLALCFSGCGSSKEEIIDYADAESFEAALNRGENLEGKIVRFTALKLEPQSVYGYDIWAGEHLNFISGSNPDVEIGSTVTVKAITIESILGSWLISYEKVDHAVIGGNTISSAKATAAGGSAAAGTSAAGTTAAESTAALAPAPAAAGATLAASEPTWGSADEIKALEIVDAGAFLSSSSSYSDTAYINYCVIIKNSNSGVAATFPEATVTLKNGSEILATDSIMGAYVMPGDTVALVGLLSVIKSEIADDTTVHYSAECSNFVSTENSDMVSSSGFEVSNVSEHSGSSASTVTGEITNNTGKDIDMVSIAVVMTNGGEIVYAESTYLDGLSAGQTKAFEFSRYSGYPEHDEVKVYAQDW